MSNKIDSVVRFIVKEALKDNNLVACQTRLTIAVDVIKEYDLSQKTKDWMVTKLIERYGGQNNTKSLSFIHLVYGNILRLIKLGVSESIVEGFLEQVIIIGWLAPARDLASKFLKRNLSLGEVRFMLKVKVRSASHASNDEQDFLKFVRDIGCERELEEEVKKGFAEKRKRFKDDCY